ncbi:MAG: hypothetical protein J5792_04105 [Bacteroidales bacterium]|nr:hypothetical protein [Bacteroidales bacterium]
MKKFFILLLSAFLGLEGYSQLVHYGYPTEREALPKKSVVILNIPHHQTTGGYYFINEEQIDSLVAFLETIIMHPKKRKRFKKTYM